MIQKIFLSLLVSVCFFCVSAQPAKKPKPSVITQVAKFKPPVVKTFLGRNTNEASVTVEEANQLVTLPLRVTDDKNVTYTISSYQFMYRKKSVIENEQTGKKEIAYSSVSDLFKTTPLPKVWKDNISGGIQKNEELFFFDIVVTDKLSRKFFAPNIKILVK